MNQTIPFFWLNNYVVEIVTRSTGTPVPIMTSKTNGIAWILLIKIFQEMTI
uniref:Uncharacterized protein n=1 Tax=Arundo donax TaxID=35708 RepID=A0A0A9B119_ARUDO